MDQTVDQACSRIGWANLYQQFFPVALSSPSGNGEIYLRSPFPFSSDTHPSFELNVVSGLWRDFHAERIIGRPGGNLIQFIAYMRSNRVDQRGMPIADFGKAERELKAYLGIGQPIDAQWLQRCQADLAQPTSRGHQLWNGRKPWSHETLVKLEIGYDNEKGRLVIPTQEPNGTVANCRMYRPGADIKMLWHNVGMSGNFLFPHCAWQESWVLLVEGESDAITLRSLGYNAASGTMGAGNPVPEGQWWINKRIWLWMDNDEPGKEAQTRAAQTMRDGALDIRLVRFPTWEGMSNHADASEYVQHLLAIGFGYEQIQNQITHLLQSAPSFNNESQVYEQPPIIIPFSQVLTARNMDTRVQFNAHLVSKSEVTFAVPTRIGINCPGTGYNMCNNCIMHTQFRGNAHFTLDPRHSLSLKTIMVSEIARDKAIKIHFHIPARCEYSRVVIEESTDLGTMVLTNTLAEGQETGTTFEDQRRHEGLVLFNDARPNIAESRDYVMSGYIRPMPQNQKSILYVDEFEPMRDMFSSFELTTEAINMMRNFVPQISPTETLASIAADTASAYTMIRGRMDLHLLMRSVFFSLTSFNFAGDTHERGWIEALIIGDTRTGKSATFSKMASLYGSGVLVDTKMQTAVGLLGSVETSQLTGERYVVAGLFPRQDRTGPICLDEYSYYGRERQQLSVLDHLSSTRASGVTKITKAAHASYPSRVRMILIANPGAGRLMRDIGGNGVEIISRLISQPEDIARFDISMAVSQQDVHIDQINDLTPPSSPRWTQEMHRTLLAWAWSRRPEQVIWKDNAEEAVIDIANKMIGAYDAAIPLVEPAYQRMRVAKLAVSIAVQVFSTDETSQNVEVYPEHVHAAASLFVTWYNKPAFGYDTFSNRLRTERNILNPADVYLLLDTIFGEHRVLLANNLMRVHKFSANTFANIIPMKFTDVTPTLQRLMINRCIRLSSERGESYEIAPAFIELLRNYAQSRGG